MWLTLFLKIDEYIKKSVKILTIIYNYCTEKLRDITLPKVYMAYNTFRAQRAHFHLKRRYS